MDQPMYFNELKRFLELGYIMLNLQVEGRAGVHRFCLQILHIVDKKFVLKIDCLEWVFLCHAKHLHGSHVVQRLVIFGELFQLFQLSCLNLLTLALLFRLSFLFSPFVSLFLYVIIRFHSDFVT